MKIKSNVRYAIRMMIDIMDNSKTNEPVQLKDVSKRQGISKRYLSQLVIPLRNASLLKSIHGRHGGYVLAKQPNNIKIGQIFEALNGPIALLDCLEGEEFCIASSYCICRKVWLEVNNKIKETLYSFSLRDLSEKDVEATQFQEVAYAMESFPNQCRSYSECKVSPKSEDTTSNIEN